MLEVWLREQLYLIHGCGEREDASDFERGMGRNLWPGGLLQALNASLRAPDSYSYSPLTTHHSLFGHHQNQHKINTTITILLISSLPYTISTLS